MKKLLLALLTLVLLPSLSLARGKTQGWCQDGNATVTIPGTQGSGALKFQASYPSCTVTVYLSGTVTLATLFADDSGTAKANPFTAASSGQFFFYADDGRYDVTFSGGGIVSPFTLGDMFTIDTARFKQVRNVCDPKFTGTDAAAKISNAVADLPSSGGVVDARCLTGAQTGSTTVTFDRPVSLLLGNISYTSSASPAFATLASNAANGSTIWGIGQNVTKITGAGGAANVFNMVDMNRWLIGRLTIDGAGTSGTVFHLASRVSGSSTAGASTFFDVNFQNGSTGFWVDTADTLTFLHCQFDRGSATQSGSVGLRIDNSQSVKIKLIGGGFTGGWNRGVSNAEVAATNGTFELDHITFSGDCLVATCATNPSDVFVGVSGGPIAIRDVFTETGERFLKCSASVGACSQPITIENLFVSSINAADNRVIDVSGIGPVNLFNVYDTGASHKYRINSNSNGVMNVIGGYFGNATPFEAGTINDFITTKGAQVNNAVSHRLFTDTPRSQAYKAAAQSLTNNVETTLTFDTNGYDAAGDMASGTAVIHNTGSNPTRFTIPSGQPGIYMVTCNVGFVANTTGSRYVKIIKNGTNPTTIPISSMVATLTLDNNHFLQVNFQDQAVAGDYYECNAFQDSGGPLNTIATATWMAIVKLGSNP